MYSKEFDIIRLRWNKRKDKKPSEIEENFYNLRILGNIIVYIPLKAIYFIKSNKLEINSLLLKKKSIIFL